MRYPSFRNLGKTKTNIVIVSKAESGSKLATFSFFSHANPNRLVVGYTNCLAGMHSDITAVATTAKKVSLVLRLYFLHTSRNHHPIGSFAQRRNVFHSVLVNCSSRPGLDRDGLERKLPQHILA